MTRLITISGSSGVGKSTIAHLLQKMLGDLDTLVISGDDLHLYERSSPVWETRTHLDPSCNDLSLGRDHITALLKRESINRKRYNHDTGRFDEPTEISSSRNIIYEGLHALYDDEVNSMSHCKIFVETDERLKNEWKLRRDTQKRGYTEAEVFKILERRKRDEELYIAPQRASADVIVTFSKSSEQGVAMQVICINKLCLEIANSLKDFYDSVRQLVTTCIKLSLEPSLLQEKGGNASVKSLAGLLITESGSPMSNVSLTSGYCLCSSAQASQATTEEDYTRILLSHTNSAGRSPSMETGLHLKSTQKCVIHIHPVHVLSILCSSDSREIVKEVYPDINYDYVEYVSPGHKLTASYSGTKRISFLENHGIVVCAEDMKDAYETAELLDRRAKMWLEKRVDTVFNSEILSQDSPLFPDAVVFPEKMRSTNSEICKNLMLAGLQPRFLQLSHIEELKNMKLESLRKEMR